MASPVGIDYPSVNFIELFILCWEIVNLRIVFGTHISSLRYSTAYKILCGISTLMCYLHFDEDSTYLYCYKIYIIVIIIIIIISALKCLQYVHQNSSVTFKSQVILT